MSKASAPCPPFCNGWLGLDDIKRGACGQMWHLWQMTHLLKQAL